MIFPNPVTFIRAVFRSTVAKRRGYDLLATEEEQESRWIHCLPCPYKIGEQCKLCTCFLHAKIMLTQEECPKPVSKWGRILRRSHTV